MKKLGIIGGLGPLATAQFLRLVTQLTQAEKDQDHIEIVLYSRPAIPDRTAFILGESMDSPEGDLVSLAVALEQAGAEVIAVPCFTAFHFYDAMQRAVNVPIINPIEESVRILKAQGIQAAGIMATDGALRGRLYQDRLAAAGIKAILPDAPGQKTVMDIIYKGIKKGGTVDTDAFEVVAASLRAAGAETILLACSELSLVYPDGAPPGYVDVLAVLASCAVGDCGRP